MNSPNICAMVCVFSVPPDLGWCDDFSGFSPVGSGFDLRLSPWISAYFPQRALILGHHVAMP